MRAGPRLWFELFRAKRMTLPELKEALDARAKDTLALGRKHRERLESDGRHEV